MKENEGAGIWRNRNVIAMGVTSFFADFSYEMGNAILPALLTVTLESSPLALGLIEGTSDGVSSVSKSVSGYLSDRSGKRKPLINFGYLISGLLVPAIGLVTNAAEVFLLKTGAWFGRGLRGPPRDALLVDSVESKSVGRAFGLQRAMDQAGAVLGPLVAVLLAAYLSYSAIYIVGMIPGLLAFLTVTLVVREVKRPSETPNESRPSLLESMKALPKRFNLFVIGAGIFGIANFANTLLVLRALNLLTPVLGSATAAQVSFLLYALLNGVYSVASYPVGHFGDRWSKRNLLVIGYVLFAITSAGMAFAGPTLTSLIMLFVLAGLSIALVDTSEAGFAAELMPVDSRGTAFGVLHTVNGVGDFISSVTVSGIWILLSAEVAFSYAAVLSLASGFLMLILTRRTSTPLEAASQG